ncbi:MAG: hypothetical protein IJ451_02765 [Ruminococcus sp.]|nr:hypothetical protein [Ruminococcus sp.]
MKKLSKDKLTMFLSSDKARMIFVFVGLAAILLIFLSGQFTSEKENIDKETQLSALTYSENLSKQLVSMIENIAGTGEAQVLLTLESSYEYIYLDDDKTLTKILEPKIRGVAVACTGGDDPVVKEKITKMLTTVLSVSTSSISVSKLL